MSRKKDDSITVDINYTYVSVFREGKHSFIMLDNNELSSLFEEIQNPRDWKDFIQAKIPVARFAEYNKAAFAFTGGGLEPISNEDNEGMVEVFGYGYRHHIGM
jgi:hypothetical protein|tara:strand:+ start:505 stop:813 length:309 start_codon:yes stop_codon:yes gene_type:complete